MNTLRMFHTRFRMLRFPLLMGVVVVFIYTAAVVHRKGLSTKVVAGHHLPLDWSVQAGMIHQIAACQTLHLAAVVKGVDGARDMAYAIKTLVHFRKHPLELHLVTDVEVQQIMKTLFQSWELPQVIVRIYSLVNQEVDKTPESQLHALQNSLPKNLGVVLVFSSATRFLHDVSPLWIEVMEENDVDWDIAVANVETSSATDKSFLYDVALLNLPQLRARELMDPLLTTKKWLDKVSMVHFGCQWNFHVRSETAAAHCLQNLVPKVLHWDLKSVQYTQSDWLERVKEQVVALENSDGDLLRWDVNCGPAIRQPPLSAGTGVTHAECEEFINAGSAMRRLHLNFIGENYVPATDKEIDVTLASQFTVDRIGMFLKMIELWQGPIVAILHATDYDAQQLLVALKRSKSFQNRKNIVFHIVYRRKFYPINLLRNVAINQTRTSHMFFVDVDLLPMPGLYNLLRELLINGKDRSEKMLLTIPAFEAFGELEPFPVNKSELVKAWDQDKLGGYRMKRGWNLGHKSTNYPKWKTANESYVVKLEGAFEPYMVIPTKDAPLYHEKLLERMGDKISYGIQLAFLKYECLILHNAFVIHMPHPVSEGTQMWGSNRKYFKCGSVLFQEYKKDLNLKYNGAV